MPLTPDLVIVTVGWNDLSWSYGSGWFKERSIAFRWAPPRFAPALLAMARERAAASSARDAPDPRAVEAFEQNLETIVALGHEHGFRVLLTNLPTILSFP